MLCVVGPVDKESNMVTGLWKRKEIKMLFNLTVRNTAGVGVFLHELMLLLFLHKLYQQMGSGCVVFIVILSVSV